jgi:hypothetical protein
MLSFEEVGNLLDKIAEKFPEEFYRELNGGISLLHRAKRNREGPDLYVMGEYCYDAMGRYINLYYGSFRAVYGNEPDEKLKEELYATLSHEFTHHMESLAGERGLVIKDEQFMEEYRRTHKQPEKERKKELP